MLAALLTVAALGSAAAAAPSATTAATTAVTYRLPLPAGTSALVTQGNGGPYTHKPRGFSEFAWDLALPVGSMVAAAAEGTVVAVEQGYSGGGVEDTYRSRSNHVLIAHADGRYSLYLHLAYRGSLVTLGQQVRAGQGIALSGATGYTTGPHLHFQVQETATVGRSWSVPVVFADAGVPAYGSDPVSGNAYEPPAPAPRAADDGLTFPGLAAPPPGPLFTHQGLSVGVDWAGGSSRSDVRVVMADGAGRRTVVTAGTAAGPGGLRGRAVASVPGPVTLWVEYRDGLAWNVLPTVAGELVCFTTSAVAHDVFVSTPGLVVRPVETPDEADQGAPRAYDVAFTVANLGSEPRRLRDLTLEVSHAPAASLGDAPADRSTVIAPIPAPPVLRDVYLSPGGARTWRGTLSLSEPGRYTLAPTARDSAGDRVPLPPAEVGPPAVATIVIEGEEPPPARQAFADVPPSHPAFTAIESLAARGLVGGYAGPDGTRVFRPDDPVTRAQFAKLVVESLGLPVSEADVCPFVDVEVSGADGLFPDNYVAVAASAGITRGTALDPPRFSPYAPVTRSQATTMIARADPGGTAFLPGDPQSPASRAEAAALAATLLR